tara:strand:+ start:121 stop:825 length:705 start_codon:yes stop_codon:yes gene_type:complete
MGVSEATTLPIVEIRRDHAVKAGMTIHREIVEEYRLAMETGDARYISARGWFFDHTYFKTKEALRRVERHIMAKGGIPLSDWSNMLRCWVLHTMLIDGVAHKKAAAAEFEPPPPEPPTVESEPEPAPLSDGSMSERDFETAYCRKLASEGVTYRRQVSCEAGIADVLTDEEIIEIKLNLSQSRLFGAMGQVLAYQAEIAPEKRAVILTNKPPKKAHARKAARLGITIRWWRAEQ